ncbi:hypothetical protein HY990_04570 [Candidatus Micrarchaeota archaeon]|nr:hypothetical protein [Candidatus Micrarchaeota archaeon]
MEFKKKETIILIIAILACGFLVFGCVDSKTPQIPPKETDISNKNIRCNNITQESPVIKTECTNVSFTEPVCINRELPYRIEPVNQVDICSLDSNSENCLGKPLSMCQHCEAVTTTCAIKITNLDSLKAGEWEFGANMSVGRTQITKEKKTIKVEPGATETLKYDHNYNTNGVMVGADCNIFVSKKPQVFECNQITRERVECKNITDIIRTVRQDCS